MLNTNQFKSFMARRAAVQGLKKSVDSSNFSQGFNRGSGFNPGLSHDPSNPFSPSKNMFNSQPNAQVNSARTAAVSAGVSGRKINRVVARSEKKAMKPTGAYSRGLKSGMAVAHDTFPFK
jgi:hypothetical protein